MDAAEYKHVVLGLIFLKYISDTFEEHRAKLLAGSTRAPRVGSGAPADPLDQYAGANPEDPDEYKAENVFWVPAEARWSHLQASAKQPTIGKIVDDAMVAIERDNPRLKGVLPKDYARPALDKHRLGELIDLIGTIDLVSPSPQPSPSGRGSQDAKLPSPTGRRGGDEGRLRDRRKQTLFIDARKLGTLIDRVHRELTDADLEKITSTYHAWRGDVSGSARAPRAVSGALAGNISSTGEAALSKSSTGAPKTTREGACAPQYADIPGFCKSATTAEIAAHGHVLTPGRYVGAEEIEDDGEPFEAKMSRLVAELRAQFAESAKLEAAIRANLKSLNFTP